jgi:hypothetical protein
MLFFECPYGFPSLRALRLRLPRALHSIHSLVRVLSMPKLIAVTGATGQCALSPPVGGCSRSCPRSLTLGPCSSPTCCRQGGAVVDHLLTDPAHFRVRAVSRDPSSPAAQALAARGCEVVKADLSSLEETTAAFDGAWGVFGLTQFYTHGYGPSLPSRTASFLVYENPLASDVAFPQRPSSCTASTSSTPPSPRVSSTSSGPPSTGARASARPSPGRPRPRSKTGSSRAGSRTRSSTSRCTTRTSGRPSSRRRTTRRGASTGRSDSCPTCPSSRSRSPI